MIMSCKVPLLVYCFVPVTVLLLDCLHIAVSRPGLNGSLGLLCGQKDSRPFADVTKAAGDVVGVALETRQGSAGNAPELAGYPDGFVYVYAMPKRFTDHVFNRTAAYHDTQYDTDVHLHRFLLTSRVRTLNPEAASLFYIPMYLGYYLNTQWSFEKEDGAPFKEGVAHASRFVSDALDHVRTSWPFWNRTNGADHVAVFGYDNGRCDAYGFLKDARREVGQLISIQANGDLVARSWAHQYDPDRAPDDFFCHAPGRDVVVPMWLKPNRIVRPLESNRSIPLLYRFSARDQHGARYGHEIRKELHEQWVRDPFPGSDFAARTAEETLADMSRAVFCVTPPGNTQDTARFWKAISMGCIPVSFFRAFDRPFERSRLLDYDTFTVNLETDDITGRLNDVIRAILDDPARLRTLQDGLARVQELLQYDKTTESGSCYGLILKELAIRATGRGAASKNM
ncbi:Exostosin family protein [Klebsormidium nitens]|uniref:Exostosin family protein n=1 Tax=Klebsormidium nitens TaxID=105231 RepID=A0A1Y1HVW9_KLENI|nr:Exostosin family protein [Klebsormidium nitens]|eukprot:GAQ82765.1 Exostosin family protein [Klebsormidium nitens]